MTEKQIIDRLDSINLSLRQKKDLIDIIKDIAANSSGGGGGTSTDKDALDIYLDTLTLNITVNDKVYITSEESGDYITIKVTDKKLYDTLYNFLYDTHRTIYLKPLLTNETQLFGTCTGGSISETRIVLMFLTGDVGVMTILVDNE